MHGGWSAEAVSKSGQRWTGWWLQCWDFRSKKQGYQIWSRSCFKTSFFLFFVFFPCADHILISIYASLWKFSQRLLTLTCWSNLKYLPLQCMMSGAGDGFVGKLLHGGSFWGVGILSVAKSSRGQLKFCCTCVLSCLTFRLHTCIVRLKSQFCVSVLC